MRPVACILTCIYDTMSTQWQWVKRAEHSAHASRQQSLSDSCEPFSFSRKRVVAHRAKLRLGEIHVRKIITSQPHEGRPTAVKSKSVKSRQTKARVPRREQPHAPTSRTGRADRCDDNRRPRCHPALRPGSSYTSKANPPKKGTQSEVSQSFS